MKKEGPITDNTLDLMVDTDAQPCLLYLYGDPGTKFSVDETEEPAPR